MAWRESTTVVTPVSICPVPGHLELQEHLATEAVVPAVAVVPTPVPMGMRDASVTRAVTPPGPTIHLQEEEANQESTSKETLHGMTVEIAAEVTDPPVPETAGDRVIRTEEVPSNRFPMGWPG